MLWNWLRTGARNTVLAGCHDAVQLLGVPLTVEGNDPLAALQARVAGLVGNTTAAAALPAPAATAPPVGAEAPAPATAGRGRKRASEA